MIKIATVSHFNIRLGEWLAATIFVTMAILFFAEPYMFERSPAYFVGLSVLAPQERWAFVFLICGGVRLCALYVNGRKAITPYIRMLLSFLSCFVWWQLIVSLFASGVPGLGWAIVPWLLALDMYNVFRSSADAREVYDKQRAEQYGTGTVS